MAQFNEEDRQWYYNKAKEMGIDTGSEEDFKASMNDDTDRQWYYELFKGAGVDTGSEDDFKNSVYEPAGEAVANNAQNAQGATQEYYTSEEAKKEAALFGSYNVLKTNYATHKAEGMPTEMPEYEDFVKGLSDQGNVRQWNDMLERIGIDAYGSNKQQMDRAKAQLSYNTIRHDDAEYQKMLIARMEQGGFDTLTNEEKAAFMSIKGVQRAVKDPETGKALLNADGTPQIVYKLRPLDVEDRWYMDESGRVFQMKDNVMTAAQDVALTFDETFDWASVDRAMAEGGEEAALKKMGEIAGISFDNVRIGEASAANVDAMNAAWEQYLKHGKIWDTVTRSMDAFDAALEENKKNDPEKRRGMFEQVKYTEQVNRYGWTPKGYMPGAEDNSPEMCAIRVGLADFEEKMKTQPYGEKALPQLARQFVDAMTMKLAKMNAPKDFWDYIIKRGLQDTLIGQLMLSLTKTDTQRYLHELGQQYAEIDPKDRDVYHAGMISCATRGMVTFAGDWAAFEGAGAVMNATAIRGIKALGRMMRTGRGAGRAMVDDLAASIQAARQTRGLAALPEAEARKAAARTIDRLLLTQSRAWRVGQGLVEGSVKSGGTFGIVDAVKAPFQKMNEALTVKRKVKEYDDITGREEEVEKDVKVIDLIMEASANGTPMTGEQEAALYAEAEEEQRSAAAFGQAVGEAAVHGYLLGSAISAKVLPMEFMGKSTKAFVNAAAAPTAFGTEVLAMSGVDFTRQISDGAIDQSVKTVMREKIAEQNRVRALQGLDRMTEKEAKAWLAKNFDEDLYRWETGIGLFGNITAETTGNLIGFHGKSLAKFIGLKRGQNGMEWDFSDIAENIAENIRVKRNLAAFDKDMLFTDYDKQLLRTRFPEIAKDLAAVNTTVTDGKVPSREQIKELQKDFSAMADDASTPAELMRKLVYRLTGAQVERSYAHEVEMTGDEGRWKVYALDATGRCVVEQEFTDEAQANDAYLRLAHETELSKMAYDLRDLNFQATLRSYANTINKKMNEIGRKKLIGDLTPEEQELQRLFEVISTKGMDAVNGVLRKPENELTEEEKEIRDMAQRELGRQLADSTASEDFKKMAAEKLGVTSAAIDNALKGRDADEASLMSEENVAVGNGKYRTKEEQRILDGFMKELEAYLKNPDEYMAKEIAEARKDAGVVTKASVEDEVRSVLDGKPIDGKPQLQRAVMERLMAEEVLKTSGYDVTDAAKLMQIYGDEFMPEELRNAAGTYLRTNESTEGVDEIVLAAVNEAAEAEFDRLVALENRALEDGKEIGMGVILTGTLRDGRTVAFLKGSPLVDGMTDAVEVEIREGRIYPKEGAEPFAVKSDMVNNGSLHEEDIEDASSKAGEPIKAQYDAVIEMLRHGGAVRMGEKLVDESGKAVTLLRETVDETTGQPVPGMWHVSIDGKEADVPTEKVLEWRDATMRKEIEAEKEAYRMRAQIEKDAESVRDEKAEEETSGVIAGAPEVKASGTEPERKVGEVVVTGRDAAGKLVSFPRDAENNIVLRGVNPEEVYGLMKDMAAKTGEDVGALAWGRLKELMKRTEDHQKTAPKMGEDPEAYFAAKAQHNKEAEMLMEERKAMIRVIDQSRAEQLEDKTFKGLLNSWEAYQMRDTAPKMYERVEALAKIFGAPVEFRNKVWRQKGFVTEMINGKKVTRPNMEQVNGKNETYKRKDGSTGIKVVVNTDDGNGGVDITPDQIRKTYQEYLAQVLGHESMHSVFRENMERLNEIIGLTKEYLGEELYKQIYEQTASQYSDPRGVDINQEIVCDMVGQMLGDAKFLDMLIERAKADTPEDVETNKPNTATDQLNRIQKVKEDFINKILDGFGKVKEIISSTDYLEEGLATRSQDTEAKNNGGAAKEPDPDQTLADILTDMMRTYTRTQMELDKQKQEKHREMAERMRIEAELRARREAAAEAERLKHKYERDTRALLEAPAKAERTQRHADLELISDPQKRLEKARELFAGYEDAMNVLNDEEPRTLEEYVGGIEPRSVAWEDKEVDGRRVKGLKSELMTQRKIGNGGDTKAFEILLAAKGEGRGIDEVVHSLWEGLPEHLKAMYDDVAVKDALLNVLQSATSAKELRHQIAYNRIAEAERLAYESDMRDADEQFEYMSKEVDGVWVPKTPEEMAVQQIEADMAHDMSAEANAPFSVRKQAPPKRRKYGYKAFKLINGQLYPPMVDNADGAPTELGLFLDAEEGIFLGKNGTKERGKVRQRGGGELSFRPGWHLGYKPDAKQFYGKGKNAGKTQGDIVWCLVEFDATNDYSVEADAYGISDKGSWAHAMTGVPYLPKNGMYEMRTNPDPTTDAWAISGAMRVVHMLTRAEEANVLSRSGDSLAEHYTPEALTDDIVARINAQIDANLRKSTSDEEYLRVKDSIGKVMKMSFDEMHDYTYEDAGGVELPKYEPTLDDFIRVRSNADAERSYRYLQMIKQGGEGLDALKANIAEQKAAAMAQEKEAVKNRLRAVQRELFNKYAPQLDEISKPAVKDMCIVDDEGNTLLEKKDGGLLFSARAYKGEDPNVPSTRDVVLRWAQDHGGWDIVEKMDRLVELSDSLLGELDEDGNPKYRTYAKWANTSVVLDKEGKPAFTIIKKNGEYPLNIDASTNCKKREETNAVLNDLISEGLIGKNGLSKKDIVALKQIITKHGLEIACDICFVDERRYQSENQGKATANAHNFFIKEDLLKGTGLTMDDLPHFNFAGDVTKEEVNDFDYERLNWKLLAKRKGTIKDDSRLGVALNGLLNNHRLAKVMDWADFVGTEGTIGERIGGEDGKYAQKLFNKVGTSIMKRSEPQAHNLHQILTDNSVGGKSSFTIVPKTIAKDENGNLYWEDAKGGKKMFGDTEKARHDVYLIGGVRLQSFSDAQAWYWFDDAETLCDLALKKLGAHKYTKELWNAKLFGKTGLKQNMSAVARLLSAGTVYKEDNRFGKAGEPVAPGLDEYGKPMWADHYLYTGDEIVASIQSINVEEAKRLHLTKGYSADNGVIAVGTSDEQIISLQEDDGISQIIGFHTNLKGDGAKTAGLDGSKNYVNCQHERAFVSEAERQAWLNGEVHSTDDKVGKGFESRKKAIGDWNYYEALERYYEQAKRGEIAMTEVVDKATKEYLDRCWDMGVLPEFDQYAWLREDSWHGIDNFRGRLLLGEDGRPIMRPGYYKHVTDYCIVDGLTGEYAPQRPVTMTFPTEEDAFGSFEAILKDALKMFDETDLKRDAAHEQIKREYRQYTEERNEGVRKNAVSGLKKLKVNPKSKLTEDEMEAVQRFYDAISGEDIDNLWSQIKSGAIKVRAKDIKAAAEYGKDVTPAIREGEDILEYSERLKAWRDEQKANPAGEVYSTRKQEEQVHSDNFKKWFGDWEKDPEGASKVVDEEGRPLVVYHYTKAGEFNVFEHGHGDTTNSLSDVGFWFSPVESFGDNFAKGDWRGKDEDKRTMAVYLDMKHPKVYESKGEVPEDVLKRYDDLLREKNRIESEYIRGSYVIPDERGYFSALYHDDKQMIDFWKTNVWKPERIEEAVKRYKELEVEFKEAKNAYLEYKYGDAYEQFRTDIYKQVGENAEKANTGGIGMYIDNLEEAKQKYIRGLREQGYDGIIIRNTSYDAQSAGGNNDQYVAFESTQIKSSTDNNGDFDGKNPDIRYSLNRGVLSEKNLKAKQEELIDALKARGFKNVFKSESHTDFGNSYYVKVWDNDFRRELAKFRVSDHSVLNYDRLQKEVHLKSDGDVGKAIKEAFGNNGAEKYSLRIRKNDPFYSNAAKAVEGIKQDKATGEQWLAMIKKAGGLKAEEDKWMGLSDWLKDKKTVTRDEVMKFIAENAVKIEEVKYEDRGSESDFNEDDYISTLDREFENLRVDFGAEEAYRKMQERHAGIEEFAVIDGMYLDWEEATDRDWDFYEWSKKDSASADGTRGIQPTRLAYTTDGLANKREIALTVPTIKPYNAEDDIHFGDAGEGRAVVWTRFGDAVDTDGNKVLVIDELQSKRHQDGREQGYRLSEKEAQKLVDENNNKRLDALQKGKDKVMPKLTDKIENEIAGYVYKCLSMDKNCTLETAVGYCYNQVSDVPDEAEGWTESKIDKVGKVIRENTEIIEGKSILDYIVGNVPDAPFQKNWHELGMKRMLRYAAENGYDKVAWTTGIQQADRYDMARHISEISYKRNNGDERVFTLMPKGAGAIDIYVEALDKPVFVDGHREWEGHLLSEIVGKDVAEQMWNLNKGDRIEGRNIVAGGEGMKGFYDQMLPRFMDKYGKKWGVRTQDVELDLPNEADRVMHAVDVTPEMKESVMQGQAKFSSRHNRYQRTLPPYGSEVPQAMRYQPMRGHDNSEPMSNRDPNAPAGWWEIVDPVYPENKLSAEGRVRFDLYNNENVNAMRKRLQKLQKSFGGRIGNAASGAFGYNPDGSRKMYADAIKAPAIGREMADGLSKLCGVYKEEQRNYLRGLMRDHADYNTTEEFAEALEMAAAVFNEKISEADKARKWYEDFAEGEVPLIRHADSHEDNGIRYSIRGEKGARNLDLLDGGERINNLAKARALHADGRSALMIRRATGWELGADGKWKLEGDDMDTSLLEDGFKLALSRGEDDWAWEGNLNEFKEVKDAYPDTDVKVEISYLPAEEMDGKTHEGAYYPEEGLIRIFVSDSEKIRPCLVHETQHYIQEQEGFAVGASPSDKDYNKVAGEVEARNAAYRTDYSDDMRRYFTLERDEDVPRSEQILRFEGVEAAGDMPRTPDGRYSTRRRQGESEEAFAQRKADALRGKQIAADAEAARKQLINEIKSLIDSKMATHMQKSDLNRQLSLVQYARPENLVESISKAKNVARDIQTRMLGQQLYRLLNLKTQDRNGRNMSIAKNVSNDVREILDNVRGRMYGVMMTDADDAIHTLRSENYRLNEQKRRASAAGEDTSEITAQMEQNRERIKQLEAEKDVTIARNLSVGEGDIQSQIDAKMQYMDACVDHEKEETWTHKDTQDLATLEILKARMDIATLDAQIKDYEKQWTEAATFAAQRGIASQIDDLKRQRVLLVGNLVDKVQEVVDGGKTSLQMRISGEIEHRRDMLNGIFGDIDGGRGKKRSDAEMAKRHNEGWFKSLATKPLGSFEYMANRIDINHMSHDGWFYKTFVTGKDGVMEAENNYLRQMNESMTALQKKTEEILGMKVEKAAETQNKVVEDTGITLAKQNQDGSMAEREKITGMSKAQATYLWMVWKMPDGRAKMENEGYDEQSMSEIREFIGEKNVAWTNWVQEEFLPGIFVRYNGRYLEMYGTPMRETENYVPLRYREGIVGDKSDLSGDKVQFSMQQKNGSMINRTVNLNPISRTTNAFNLICQHVNEAEEYTAFARVRKDLEDILNSKAVQKQLDANVSGQYKALRDAARVAVHAFSEDVNGVDRAVGKVSKGLIGANIAFRNSTALKQMLSVPAFLGYSQDPRFVAAFLKNTGVQYGGNAPAVVGTMASFGFAYNKMMERMQNGEKCTGMTEVMRWCVDNMPSFRDRLMKGTMGMEVLADDMSDASRFEKAVDKYLQLGMNANKMIDAITCAVGIKSIYDYRLARLKEQGLPEEEAQRMALMEADIYYNGTQQSNHKTFMSPMQVSKTSVNRMMSVYQNASIGFARKCAESYQNLSKAKNVEAMIRRYASEHEKDGMQPDEAMKKAKSEVWNSIRKAAVSMAVYGIGTNLIWDMGSRGLIGLFQSEEEKDKALAWTSLVSYPMRGMPLMNAGASLIQSASSIGTGEEAQMRDYNPFLLYASLNDAVAAVGRSAKDFGAVSPMTVIKVLDKGLGIAGFRPEIWVNTTMALEDLIVEGAIKGDDVDKMTDLMLLLQTPNSLRPSVAKDLYAPSKEELSKMSEEEQRAAVIKYVKSIVYAMKYADEGAWQQYVPGMKVLKADQKQKVYKELIDEVLPEEMVMKATANDPELAKELKVIRDIQELEEQFETTGEVGKRMQIGKALKAAYKTQEVIQQTGEETVGEVLDKYFEAVKPSDAKKVSEAYMRLSTKEDLKEDLALEKKVSGLKSVKDQLDAIEDDAEAGEYAESHKAELVEYRRLKGNGRKVKGIMQKIAKEKRKLIKPDGNDTEVMTEIRRLRSDALSK